MAAVPITIHGVIYPSGKSGGRAASDQPFKATFVGLAWNPNLGVGGGPIYPPVDPPPVDPPIDPPPPDPAPGLTTVAKPPPAGGGWGFFPEYGWLYYPAGAQPKR